MSDTLTITKPRTVTKPKVEMPKLYKVILLNDDYTPREFVVRLLTPTLHPSPQGGGKTLASHPPDRTPSRALMLTAGRCVDVLPPTLAGEG